MDFGGMVGKGGGNKAGEVEDVLGTIASGRGQQRLHCEHPGWTAMAISHTPTPTLACIVGITGKGGDGKDVIVLIVVVVGRGVKTNNN